MITYGYLGRKLRHERTDRTETLSFRCSEELKVKVDAEVAKLGLSKADFMENAIEAALSRGDRDDRVLHRRDRQQVLPRLPGGAAERPPDSHSLRASGIRKATAQD